MVKKAKKDGQLVEILNTHRAIASALAANIDVARPERDDGIDVIIYGRKDGKRWLSKPVQIKSRFHIEKKYNDRPGLVMCYVCAATLYVLTHEEAKKIATARGYTAKPSWTKKGRWSCRIGKTLAQDLESYRDTPERWASVLRRA